MADKIERRTDAVPLKRGAEQRSERVILKLRRKYVDGALAELADGEGRRVSARAEHLPIAGEFHPDRVASGKPAGQGGRAGDGERDFFEPGIFVFFERKSGEESGGVGRAAVFVLGHEFAPGDEDAACFDETPQRLRGTRQRIPDADGDDRFVSTEPAFGQLLLKHRVEGAVREGERSGGRRDLVPGRNRHGAGHAFGRVRKQNRRFTRNVPAARREVFGETEDLLFGVHDRPEVGGGIGVRVQDHPRELFGDAPAALFASGRFPVPGALRPLEEVGRVRAAHEVEPDPVQGRAVVAACVRLGVVHRLAVGQRPEEGAHQDSFGDAGVDRRSRTRVLGRRVVARRRFDRDAAAGRQRDRVELPVDFEEIHVRARQTAVIAAAHDLKAEPGIGSQAADGFDAELCKLNEAGFHELRPVDEEPAVLIRGPEVCGRGEIRVAAAVGLVHRPGRAVPFFEKSGEQLPVVRTRVVVGRFVEEFAEHERIAALLQLPDARFPDHAVEFFSFGMERIVRDPVVVGPGAVFVDCSFRQPGGECRILGDFSVAPREGREVHKGRQPVRLHGFPGRLVFFGERLVAEFREDSPDPVGGGENGDRVEAEALRVPIGQRLLVEPFQACVVAAGRSDVVG